MADRTSEEGIHEYDGIIELDNALPRWWVYVLLGTMAFALGYWLWFETFRFTPSPRQAYRAEMRIIQAEEAARERAERAVTPAVLVALSQDDARVGQGRELFATTCTACHAPNAGGNIGPNLTDEYWLYGGAPDQVFHTVMHGTPRGMPTWGRQLGQERVESVVAFLLTVRNTHVAGGKPPQGPREP